MGSLKATLNLAKEGRRLQVDEEGVPEVAGRVGGALPSPLSPLRPGPHHGNWFTTEKPWPSAVGSKKAKRRRTGPLPSPPSPRIPPFLLTAPLALGDWGWK